MMLDCARSKVSLLKVDVERAELDVLRGITREDWNNIHQVVMEVCHICFSSVDC